MKKVCCSIKMGSGGSSSKEYRDKLCPERNGMHWGCCSFCAVENCPERCLNDAKVCGILLVKGRKKEELDG